MQSDLGFEMETYLRRHPRLSHLQLFPESSGSEHSDFCEERYSVDSYLKQMARTSLPGALAIEQARREWTAKALSALAKRIAAKRPTDATSLHFHCACHSIVGDQEDVMIFRAFFEFE